MAEMGDMKKECPAVPSSQPAPTKAVTKFTIEQILGLNDDTSSKEPASTAPPCSTFSTGSLATAAPWVTGIIIAES